MSMPPSDREAEPADILAEFRVTDRELICRALRYCRPRVGKDRWSVVMDVFALGSTAARALCRSFGFDPDERRQSRGRIP